MPGSLIKEVASMNLLHVGRGQSAALKRTSIEDGFVFYAQ